MRKIDGRLHRLADPDMVGKLFAVVRRNGLGMRFMGRKQPNGGLGNCLSLFGGDFVQQGIARAPFNQRDEGAGALAPHDQIDFPIADSTFSIDDGRALVRPFAQKSGGIAYRPKAHMFGAKGLSLCGDASFNLCLPSQAGAPPPRSTSSAHHGLVLGTSTLRLPSDPCAAGQRRLDGKS